MKIRYSIITNFTGADIYFEQLARGVTQHGWQADLRTYQHLLEFLPCTTLQPFFPKQGEYDLVHTKAEYGWMFARRGKPLVATLGHSVVDNEYERYKNPAKRLYHNWKVHPNIVRTLAVADRVVTYSNFSAERICKLYGQNKVDMIYLGIDPEVFRPAAVTPRKEGDPTRLLFVGNRTPRKGFDLLQPILERLGAGYTLEYTTGLRTRNIPPPHPAMVPLGRLSLKELVEAYQRCDILLFPSRLEGFGYPVAEAMGCGKPVVTTNYSSMPELIDDGKGGFLCPMDDVEVFADRIRQLADDPDARSRMGAYNRARVEEKFTLARCLQQYIKLYQELL